MKKIILCFTLSILVFAGFNFPTLANSNNKPPGLAKKPYQLPPGQAKKLLKKKKVYIAPTRVIYTIPLLTMKPGIFYFKTQPPAYTTARRARLKGYRTNLYYFKNYWVLEVR